jgi:DNA-binding transcriptional LysR family regulator
MAHANTVLRSINLPGDSICVDLFQRPDGSFGFDEFRRDTEDGRGWFSIGHHGHLTFDSATAALDAARLSVGWLGDVLGPAE